MRVAILFALSTLLVSGCAQETLRYSKSGATQEEFMKDRYECLQAAEQPVSGAYANAYGAAASSGITPSCGVWMACLGARGYMRDENGNLAAPDGMIVQCRR